MASLYRYTAADTKAFLTYVNESPRTPFSSIAPLNSDVKAPNRRRYSSRTSKLMNRWKSRSIVRTLLPELNSAKDPLFWMCVDAAEEAMFTAA